MHMKQGGQAASEERERDERKLRSAKGLLKDSSDAVCASEATLRDLQAQQEALQTASRDLAKHGGGLKAKATVLTRLDEPDAELTALRSSLAAVISSAKREGKGALMNCELDEVKRKIKAREALLDQEDKQRSQATDSLRTLNAQLAHVQSAIEGATVKLQRLQVKSKDNEKALRLVEADLQSKRAARVAYRTFSCPNCRTELTDEVRRLPMLTSAIYSLYEFLLPLKTTCNA